MSELASAVPKVAVGPTAGPPAALKTSQFKVPG